MAIDRLFRSWDTGSQPTPSYPQQSLAVIAALVQRYRGAAALLGFGLLNEPTVRPCATVFRTVPGTPWCRCCNSHLYRTLCGKSDQRLDPPASRLSRLPMTLLALSTLLRDLVMCRCSWLVMKSAQDPDMC